MYVRGFRLGPGWGLGDHQGLGGPGPESIKNLKKPKSLTHSGGHFKENTSKKRRDWLDTPIEAKSHSASLGAPGPPRPRPGLPCHWHAGPGLSQPPSESPDSEARTPRAAATALPAGAARAGILLGMMTG